jgi:hypothetical protein
LTPPSPTWPIAREKSPKSSPWKGGGPNDIHLPLSPLFTYPVLDFVEKGLGAIRKYHVLNSFRPWWISQRYLPPAQRPVDLLSAFAWLASASIIGLVLLIAACSTSHKKGKID